MYDIMLTYLDEAKAALEAEDREGFKAGLRHADRVLVQLQDSLNFKYSPADTLYALYVYCREELALAMAKQDLTGIGHAQTVLCGLRGGFAEAAAKDTSEPLMHNTEQVYAGITYGKNNLNESFQSEASRGFFV
jgi:flagellar protein fliS